MDTRIEEAVKRKHCGFNCAQAVACTYCDYTELDEGMMKNATQAFGVGMGTMDGSCGAIAGAAVVLGMANKDQKKTFGDIRTIMTEFKDRNTTVTCKELKGLETGKVIRDCDDCIRDVAEFLEQTLQKQ
ncbi:C-GCAxxG-C-C family protein [Anaerosporobacter faecicola]|uniref:C-GCAxxG-C-C family protein n=1 Tax=Anaerosporobacter faecicola TaxID=2718714 RepID=UPI00143B4492|nr:C-GCAxxG-C-C family protein [Anaerosporobacter faecicola]